MFEITEKIISPQEKNIFVRNLHAGGIVSFEGVVRDTNNGRSVTQLYYEAYSHMAQLEGKKIIEEAINRFSVLEIFSLHRVGLLAVGEVAIWIEARSRHRKEAFLACQYTIDQMKTRLPIWKKEFYSNGENLWVWGCSHS